MTDQPEEYLIHLPVTAPDLPAAKRLARTVVRDLAHLGVIDAGSVSVSSVEDWGGGPPGLRRPAYRALSSTRVTSGGAPTRTGGPQKPAPLVTYTWVPSMVASPETTGCSSLTT